MLRDQLIKKGLTSRETEVVELIAKKLTRAQVANQIFVTKKTIDFHLKNIFKKLNVTSEKKLIELAGGFYI